MHRLDQRASRRVSSPDIAPRLWPGARVLYLGDYDLSGAQIEDNTRRVLEREVGALTISQRVLIEILRARLSQLLPEPLERVQEREARERRRIAKLIST